jgi:ribosomal protein L11 methyltransferase
MLDIGTGSGILAIAAARLGVGAVLAVDEDPDAVACAMANAARNHVSDRVRCTLADAAGLYELPVPLLVANILSAAHRRLAAQYRRSLTAGGTLLLGGILDAEAADVVAALADHELAHPASFSVEGWTTLELRAPLHDRA